MRHVIIALVVITALTTTACSESEIRARQKPGKACHIQALSIRQVVTEGPLLADPIQPDFESNCGTLPIFVQIFPPVRAEVHRVGLSIEDRRKLANEQLSAPLPQSESSLNPPYAEGVFNVLLDASLAKLRSFKPVKTSVWQKNDSVDKVRVYVGVDMLEGNWDDVLSYARQHLNSNNDKIVTEDNIADQFGLADYYENSNLKKIACDVAHNYQLECIDGTFKALNHKNAVYRGYSYKQMLETPDFGLDRDGSLKFELKPIHNNQ